MLLEKPQQQQVGLHLVDGLLVGRQLAGRQLVVRQLVVRQLVRRPLEDRLLVGDLLVLLQLPQLLKMITMILLPMMMLMLLGRLLMGRLELPTVVMKLLLPLLLLLLLLPRPRRQTPASGLAGEPQQQTCLRRLACLPRHAAARRRRVWTCCQRARALEPRQARQSPPHAVRGGRPRGACAQQTAAPRSASSQTGGAPDA